jgi:hypothetical protein
MGPVSSEPYGLGDPMTGKEIFVAILSVIFFLSLFAATRKW